MSMYMREKKMEQKLQNDENLLLDVASLHEKVTLPMCDKTLAQTQCENIMEIKSRNYVGLHANKPMRQQCVKD